jgi:hypothetical protein
VQDVTFVLPSFLHKLLHMGDITVETAGKLNDLTFLDLYDPQAVRDEIFQRMDLFRRRTVDGAAQEAVLRAWRQQEHEVALRIAQLLYDQVARVGGRGG